MEGTYRPQTRANKEAQKPKAQVTVREFSKLFLDQHAGANNRPSEHESKVSVLNRHIRPQLGDESLAALRARHIEAFKAHLARLELAPKTRNNILTVLRKLLAYAVEMEELASAPKVKLVKVEEGAAQQIEWLEHAALEQLIAAQDEPQLALAILLGAEASLRRGELAALRWADVNTRRQVLTVCRTLCFRSGKELPPKGKRSRVVPLTQRLTAALRGHKHLCPTVLVREDGTAWTKEVFRHRGERIYRLAGLEQPGMPWHCLRHTFCSHLAMAGAPVTTIMELAGHVDLATTQRYMHLSPEARRDAIALLDRRADPCADPPTPETPKPPQSML